VSGDTAATVAAALGAAINADPVLPATSTVSTVTTTVTARNKGTVGNDIDLRLNYYGASSGEKLPAGLACVVTAMSGGTGDPTLSTALNAIPDEIFDFIILPYNDSTSLGALESELNDRHGPAQMLEGHAFIAKKASAGTLNTFGAGRNNPHVTCIGFNDSPTPPYEWAAAMGAQVALSATIDPARPFTTLPLVGVLAPAAGSAFIQSERNALLFDGITTFLVLSGVVQLERVITLYQVNALSAPDPSYLDANTLLTLSHLRQTINIRIRSKFPRHKLADNGTRFGAGQAMVTPNIIRAELIALFSEWEEAGLVENLEQFKNELIVERDPVDRTRVNAQLPPDLVNQLYIFAGQVQFRL
jgi:phage tail sheath gpL-like